MPFPTCRASATISRPRPAGLAAAGPQLAAASGLRALCRAAFRLALHRAARHQRALLALPHPAERRHTGRFRPAELSTVEDGAECRRPRTGARAVALEPDADARGADRFPRRHAHHDHGRRRARPDRHGGPCLCRQPPTWSTTISSMPMASCSSCRRKAALRFVTEMGVIEIDAGRDLRAAARPGVQGRADRRAGRAAMSARITAPSSPCPIAARSAPTAWPIRATSRRRSPGSRTRRRPAG